MSVYIPEQFSDAESAILRRYFTNLDLPVFALVNLPETVKGALFARYSRTAKSLRRLFLDEFVSDLDLTGDESVDATVGVSRAEELYERIFVEYGDDSVAQLGGVHLACEQASNLLTKILEWGRLMAYLEQSTRYVAYDARLAGRYRYYRDPAVLGSPFGTRYVGDMDRMFDTYSELVEMVTTHVRATVPRGDKDSDFIYRQATRAKALDAVRGILPAASLSNVGIYGTGQGYEALLLRMRANPLPEAQAYADMMLTELRKVIPTFLRRVDMPERGVAWSNYLADNANNTAELVDEYFGIIEPQDAPEVTLVDFDPDGEDKLLAAICYSSSDLPETQLLERVRKLSQDQRVALIRAYVGERSNRRHKPGRAFERLSYRFDVLGDYGAFRDMQRHRLLTIEWQRLTPHLGYARPELIDEAGGTAIFDDAMERSQALYDLLRPEFPEQAAYGVAMAHRMRYMMHFNAREAMHMLELRSAPQGHPAYRRVALEMHRLIATQAGHHAVAGAMSHMTTEAPLLERLESERRSEQRRESQRH
ncbi:MAG: FAD-dependent thymidylate synthase [Ilumatobacteraceae bacterium]|nr:MAG: thymidylate synthase [Acidimicrobium sp. BACL19 MAG-120924-bin39]MDP4642569.1 FAD-dependent thymidylate synthase [Ilumatobacteraceae bacterium]MDP4834882.1 FAD-dependent thymidylate synthase [Ilumatobacteraceae bacterium]